MNRRDLLKLAGLGCLGWGAAGRLISAEATTPGLKRRTPGAAYQLGSDKHLFLDEFLLAEQKSVTLTVNPPQRKELVLIADQPWERNGISAYCNVFWDEEHSEHRLYYVPIHLQSNPVFRLALATSKDGIHWDKPKLGAVEWQGSKANNLVIDGQREGTVMVDPNAPPERRYAYISGASASQGTCLFVSPDGVHFRQQPQRLSPHHSDSQISSFWDGHRQKYVHHFKVEHDGKRWYGSPEIVVNQNVHFPQPEPLFRAVGRVETSSIDSPWTDPFRLVMARDEQDPNDMDLYTNSAQPYALAKGVYVAFPTPYYHYDARNRAYLNQPALALGGKTNDGTLDTQLATSRDGITWTRYRVPYVPLHQHDELALKVVMIFPGMLYYPDRIDQYFGGYAFTHGDTNARERLKGRELGGIFRLSQRIDGFTSMDFAYTGGSLVTEPLMFEGRQLELNVNTSAAGEGRVAILDEQRAEMPGFGLNDCRIINGDYLKKVVEWKQGSDLSALSGKPIRLRFDFRGSKLYAFQFAGT